MGETPGYEWQIIVRGPSMLPFLRHGQRLLVKKAINSLRPGDLLFFRIPGSERPVIHRLKKICRNDEKEFFITRGDNSGHFDTPISPEWIEGVASAIVTKDCLKPFSRLDADFAMLSAPLLFRLRELKSFLLALIRRLSYSYIRSAKNLVSCCRGITGQTMVGFKDKKFIPSPGILCEREKDGMLLFNPETGEVKILNDSGAYIFDLFNEGCNCDQIITRLEEYFDNCGHEQAAEDVLDLVRQLEKAGLIVEVQQEAG